MERHRPRASFKAARPWFETATIRRGPGRAGSNKSAHNKSQGCEMPVRVWAGQGMQPVHATKRPVEPAGFRETSVRMMYGSDLFQKAFTFCRHLQQAAKETTKPSIEDPPQDVGAHKPMMSAIRPATQFKRRSRQHRDERQEDVATMLLNYKPSHPKLLRVVCR